MDLPTFTQFVMQRTFLPPEHREYLLGIADQLTDDQRQEIADKILETAERYIQELEAYEHELMNTARTLQRHDREHKEAEQQTSISPDFFDVAFN